LRERAVEAPRLVLDAFSLSDLELIVHGGFSPLEGFMGRADYQRVLDEMRLADGTVWPLPITLSVPHKLKGEVHEGGLLRLVGPDGEVLAIMEVWELYERDAKEAEKVFRTGDHAHPGVARLKGLPNLLAGGPVWLVGRLPRNPFHRLRLPPAVTRRIFAQRGWRRIVAFQTRNPIHRAHEYIQKCALETVDGLFLHPLVGETKSDDIPAEVRMRSYRKLLSAYYPTDRVLLAVFPAAMRYAGPREAIFHALVRKNYGCTHFIVGRDHAGVGNYYGPFDAQKIFDDFRPDEIGITPLFFDHTFYCSRCGSIVSAKTCPHDRTFHLVLSGTKVREILSRGEDLPESFTRREVAEELRSHYAGAPARRQRRLMVVGLDCLEPSLAFDRWASDMPYLSHLRERGLWGRLKSTVPPITVPAWAVMMTGRDPGTLGFYGFRNRADHSYSNLSLVTSRSLRHPAVWDLLSSLGRQVIVVGVPPSYPPKPVNGLMVGCFLTPDTQSRYTYPDALAEEIRTVVGDYMVDVPNFRTEDKAWLLDRLYEMTEKRFKLVRHLAATREWELFVFVEMGTDRIHHGFWSFFDPAHRRYQAGNPYESAVRQYYSFVDQQLGMLLQQLDDDTSVMVVSDHGAKRMDGGFAINQWLAREGYLRLKETPEVPTPFSRLEIDWPRTVAWGDGGYYGRLFINVRDREPHGLVAPEDYERVRTELATRLEALHGPDGLPMGNRVFRPEDVYSQQNNVPPDLIVYFGDLYWRSVGSVGHPDVFTYENDTGPDDANHAEDGVLVLDAAAVGVGGEALGLEIQQVAPTILRLLDAPIPGDMPAPPIV
jgi:ATP sulfurylase